MSVCVCVDVCIGENLTTPDLHTEYFCFGSERAGSRDQKQDTASLQRTQTQMRSHTAARSQQMCVRGRSERPNRDVGWIGMGGDAGSLGQGGNLRAGACRPEREAQVTGRSARRSGNNTVSLN